MLGCRSGDSNLDIFCFEGGVSLDGSKGLNPLMAGMYNCYESQEKCAAVGGKSACGKIGPQKWHCVLNTSNNSYDPMATISTCLPSKNLCESFQKQMRPQLEDSPVTYEYGTCRPQDEVYCMAGLSNCVQSLSDCRALGELLSGGSEACVLKRSK